MGIENGVGKSSIAAFVKSRAENIKSKDMMDMASTMTAVIKESEKEENKGKSFSELLSGIVGTRTTSKDDKNKDNGER